MTGTMTAAPGGGGGGEEGVTVVAADLEFDTDTIELPADTPTTITFDNQEAGIPHNIAIYADDSLAEELFKGELVTGPVSVTVRPCRRCRTASTSSSATCIRT